MKTENEKLKAICDKIWYTISLDKKVFDFIPDDDWINEAKFVIIVKDVREIIFNTDFNNCFVKYLSTNRKWFLEVKEIMYELMKNLDDPVDYIYNLIKEWKKN